MSLFLDIGLQIYTAYQQENTNVNAFQKGNSERLDWKRERLQLWEICRKGWSEKERHRGGGRKAGVGVYFADYFMAVP